MMYGIMCDMLPYYEGGAAPGVICFSAMYIPARFVNLTNLVVHLFIHSFYHRVKLDKLY